MEDNLSPVEENREEEKTHFAYENDHDLKEDNFEESNEERTLEEDNREQKMHLAHEDDCDSKISWGLMEDNLNELDTENPLQDNFQENGDKQEEPESVLETNMEDENNSNCVYVSNQSLSNPFGADDEEEVEIVTVPAVVADTDDDINPFGEDDKEEVETITIPAVVADTNDDINPFGEEEEVVQNLVTATDCNVNMNPFGDDDTVDEEIHVTKTIIKQSEQQNKIIKKAPKCVSFNPFDDGSTEDEITIEKAEVIQHQQKVVESSIASIASLLNKTRNKSQLIMKPDLSLNLFSVEYDKLILLGFDKVYIYIYIYTYTHRETVYIHDYVNIFE
jgi:hypothetical protein